MLKLFTTAFFIFFVFEVRSFDHGHSEWDKILKSYTVIKDQVYFNYKALKTNQDQFKIYLKNLSSVSQKEFDAFEKNQQLAFLINVYNAFTVKLIIDNYPIKSIKKLGGFFTSAWKTKFFRLFGKKTHLDHVEHDLIRGSFKEPRIHFAANCASIGCPSLQPFAFIAPKLDAQLEKAAKEFLKNHKKNYYDAKNRTVYVSPIFKWYKKDFVRASGSLEAYLAKYIRFGSKARIKYTVYDWNLNEAR